MTEPYTDPVHPYEGKACDLVTCPRNNLDVCELSQIFPLGHLDYCEPKICYHYKFINRESYHD